ncbi:AMP nucleosidase [Martelella alba]|uniref:AMP nucleosidase n=1 Tax=Martelella alba TaxID=2590451 RepID=A0ABY2SG69_9HYPH|nr:AMP nucleosidase [Martelella alba]
MLPTEIRCKQPDFPDLTLSRKTGALHTSKTI